ncbi:MAG: hypothetical protein A3G76_13500 [Acidobacteria bacterium RIFCSPLOWO2_12_FULL_65_11]|nr:MAG: hypothetical protein A3H95_02800 [Acidobacteria bacterium RIFCSPLOWO2_02_FULL_64_15]OFW34535.1 MAG: hypothetical protein A3G76_13500 [Acidobacteria bacterium RIFCSPLOWO2_12_FULL_65_11]
MVIARDTTTKKASYALSVVPGPAQIRCQMYEHAVSTATAWVSGRQAAIWYTENGTTFTRVAPASGPMPRSSVGRPQNAE